MARKIRFPLKMKNGSEVRTLEELRINFDLESVLGYFTDGRLVKWLRNNYFDEVADKVEAIDKKLIIFQSSFVIFSVLNILKAM